jgi:hypothetical protein
MMMQLSSAPLVRHIIDLNYCPTLIDIGISIMGPCDGGVSLSTPAGHSRTLSPCLTSS